MFVQIYLLCFTFRNKKALFLRSGRFLIVIKGLTVRESKYEAYSVKSFKLLCLAEL